MQKNEGDGGVFWGPPSDDSKKDVNRQGTERFGELYPLYFPESPCLIRKMHALTFHVPMFAEEQEAIGLFSEEEGETIHKIVT